MTQQICTQAAGLPSETPKAVRIAVIGAGNFGTSMATVAARQGHNVIVYARNEQVVHDINTTHRNPLYFSNFELMPNIKATASIEEALKGSELIIHCIPAQKTPHFLAEIKEFIPKDAILCSTSKGLFLETQDLLSVPILKALERDQPLAFLSGPSFALELMQKMPTAVVVAAKYMYHAVRIQRLLSSLDFRIYSSQDIIGVQLGGALKNPLAIGAGMIEGSGYGINTLAAFVTRSSLELKQLCVAMGGNPDTISGLSGIGDLMLTAFGSLSRNRNCGARLMRGESLEAICQDYTVEGIPTAKVAVYFADKCGLDLPIFRAVNGILQGKISKTEIQNLLMNRPLRSE